MPRDKPVKQCTHVCCGGTCHRVPAPVKKGAKPISKFSDKRKKVNSRYFREAAQFIKDNPVCQIQAEGCTYWSQHPHHTQGRIGDNLTDKSKWLASCDSCNRTVEVNDKWARDNQFKKSKFTPINKP